MGTVVVPPQDEALRSSLEVVGKIDATAGGAWTDGGIGGGKAKELAP